MKFLSLFLLFSLSAQAERLAHGNGNGNSNRAAATTPRVERFSAAEFLEVLHPNNPRSPNWPERLTFTPVTSISQDEFLERMQGRWIAVYHCHGQPVEPSARLFDGINSPRTIFEYKGNVRRRLQPNRDGTGSLMVESQTNFQLNSLGSGSFRILSNGFFPSITRIVKINETGEYGMEFETTGSCPDGTPMMSLDIPLPTT